MHVYLRKLCYFYIWNICIYNINYINIKCIHVNIFKIYTVCVYLYIHNKYTKYTHILFKQKLSFWMRLIAINHLTALKYINRHMFIIIIISGHYSQMLHKYDWKLHRNCTDCFWETLIGPHIQILNHRLPRCLFLSSLSPEDLFYALLHYHFIMKRNQNHKLNSKHCSSQCISCSVSLSL